MPLLRATPHDVNDLSIHLSAWLLLPWSYGEPLCLLQDKVRLLQRLLFDFCFWRWWDSFLPWWILSHSSSISLSLRESFVWLCLSIASMLYAAHLSVSKSVYLSLYGLTFMRGAWCSSVRFFSLSLLITVCCGREMNGKGLYLQPPSEHGSYQKFGRRKEKLSKEGRIEVDGRLYKKVSYWS